MTTYRQVIQPNRSIVAQVGLCLQYVRMVFGRPAVEPTAKVGWDKAKYKHADTNFPKNVAVPLWWNWTDPRDGINYAHVVWYDPTDGTYNSSPFDTKTGWYIGKSIADITKQLQRFGKTSFLGWTEDISGARVIEPVKETKPATGGSVMKTDLTKAQWESFIKKVYKGFSARDAKADEVSFHMKNSNPLSFVNGFASFKWQDLDKQLKTVKDNNTKLSKQVADTQEALKKSNAALDAAKQSGASEELKKQLADAQKENAKLVTEIEVFSKNKTEAESASSAIMTFIRGLVNLILKKEK